MQLFLPIADIPVNVFLILAMGAAVGFVSGMFGIGGGFLMTPLLIFVGIAPAVVSSHIAASSMSGAISYWRRRSIDPALAAVLLMGGSIGTAMGVWTFTWLRSLGQLDLLIALSYVILLTTVGGLMFWEGLRAMLRARGGNPVPMRRSGSHSWVHGLPMKMRFKRSKIYLSVIPVVVIGLLIGFLGAIMGIGGGFILVPLMIYLLRVPTSTVIGTSMVLTLVTMLFATMLHAMTNHLVDAVLALILMVGGVTGAQVSASNVVVLFVTHTFGNAFDQEDEVFQIDLTGSGEAYVFRDGVGILARWYRTNRDQPLLLTTLGGSPIYMRPGITFYEVIGSRSYVDQGDGEWSFRHDWP